MKSYWTRNVIPTALQNPFDNESINPIVVEKNFYEVYRTRISSTKSVVISISVLSVVKSLCPAGAHLGWAVLQGRERTLTLYVPKGWFYLTFPFGKSFQVIFCACGASHILIYTRNHHFLILNSTQEIIQNLLFTQDRCPPHSRGLGVVRHELQNHRISWVNKPCWRR